MSRSARRVAVIGFVIAVLFGGVALACEMELRLEEGDEAMIYCGSSAFQVEMVDDLTVYLRCYDDSPEAEERYYFPAVGDTGGRP